MEGSSIDFLQLLNSDLSFKILSNLDDPVDVVRVASVSHTWRQFVIASGFSKSLCLRLFPETSSAIKAIEENNVIESLGFNTTGSLDVEKLKKNHRVYAFLASGLAPSLTKDCIVEAISASSTDHFPEENIRHTLEPREIVDGMLSYWSSLGESNPEMHETLTFKLVSKLCFITEINIQPSQEHFEDDFPIFSARAVRFRMGHVREPQQERFLLGDYKAGRRSIEDHVVWTYTSEKFSMVQENRLQKFKLPEPVLAIGGLLQIELFGAVQLDWDDLYYLCMSYVQVVGRPLINDFVADLVNNSGKCILKYNRKGAIGNDSVASEDDLTVPGFSSAVPRNLFPSHAPLDMMSQTYTYHTQNEPPSQLPEIEFTLPFSNEAGVERQIPVPRVPCHFREMNLTMEDCFRFMEKSCSYVLGSRQAAWDESYRLVTTSCSSSGISTSSSVPSIHAPNNPNEAFTSQDLTLGGLYEWATGQGFYTPRVEDGAITSQQGNAQGGNVFTDALLGESELNIVYDTRFSQQPHNFF